MQSAAKQFIDEINEYDLYLSENKNENKPDLVVKKSEKLLTGLSKVRLFLCFAMVVATVVLIIYNNVAMVELGEMISDQTDMLSELQLEGKRLQAKLDGAISLSEVGEQASSQLLMGKVEEYQVTYITLNDEDTVTRTQKTPDQTPIEKVKKTIDKLQEYMNKH